MQAEQAVINQWSDSAPYRVKHHRIIRQMFAPITQGLVEDAQIDSQHAVLDIATSPREPALSIAAAVGAAGKMKGVESSQSVT